MAKLGEREVSDAVNALKEDSAHSLMRNRMVNVLYPLHSMKLDEVLPEHFTRGDMQSIRTPMIPWLTARLINEARPYQTTTTVNPYTLGDQDRADKLERGAALFRTICDEGRAITEAMRWHMWNSAYCVPILNCGAPGEFPWSIDVPGPETCFFPVKGAQYRPKYLAREYEVLVHEIEETYVDKRQKRRPKMKKDGMWDWEEISDDHSVDTAQLSDSNVGMFEKVTVKKFYDGKHQYTLACNREGKKNTDGSEGLIIWCTEELTGGVPAVVISGLVTQIRAEAERLQPGLWPVYQDVWVLNTLRTMRATRSVQAKPDVIVGESPSEGGPNVAKQMQQAMLQQGMPNIIEVGGKPLLWTLQEDPDLDKAIADVKEELGMLVNSYMQTSSPEVVKDSNTNVWLNYSESTHRQEAPMLVPVDYAWQELSKMFLTSIAKYNQDFELYPEGGELYGSYKTMKRGKVVTITPSDVKDLKYRLTVSTLAESPADRRMRLEDALFREQVGVGTRTESIRAGGGMDDAERLEELAIDAGQKQAASLNDMNLGPSLQDRIRLVAGVLVPYTGPQATTTDGKVVGDSGTTYRAPAVQGGKGGADTPMANMEAG